MEGSVSSNHKEKTDWDFIRNVANGNLLLAEKIYSKKIRLVVLDTCQEVQALRCYLANEFYPTIQQACEEINVHFSVVDLNLDCGADDGLKGNQIDEGVYLNEVDRCLEEATVGLYFIALSPSALSHRPLPESLDACDFEQLLNNIDDDMHKKLLTDRYLKDFNAVPPKYVLQNRLTTEDFGSNLVEEESNATDDSWRKILTDVMLANDHTSNKNILCTMAEKQMQQAASHNGQIPSQKFFYLKNSVDNTNNQTQDSERYSDGMNRLKNLAKQGNYETVALEQKCLIDESQNCSHIECLKSLCETFENSIMKSIMDSIAMAPSFDESIVEIGHHGRICASITKHFIGRNPLVEEGMKYFQRSDPFNNLYVLHGLNGCGKTYLLSKLATEVQAFMSEISDRPPCIITRYCATTPQSSSVFSLLFSICQQIELAYGKEKTPKPLHYQGIIEQFHHHLQSGSEEKPLFVFIDSLEHLTDEYQGRSSLQWLPNILLPHVFVVVSTSTNISGCFAELVEKGLPTENFLDVDPFLPDDALEILKKRLNNVSREITEEQYNVVLTSALDESEEESSQLRLRLICDQAMNLHSYDKVGNYGKSIETLVDAIFDQTEAENGYEFTSAVFGLLSASKNGLSVDDLLDMLSCLDNIVNEIYEFHAGMKRVPQILFAKIRNSLHDYLFEQDVFGKPVLTWCNEIFRKKANQRYMNTNQRLYADIVRKYFSEELHVIYKERGLIWQPLYWKNQDSNMVRFNLQRLSELPTAALLSVDRTIAEHILCDFKFIAAKLYAKQGLELLQDFKIVLESISSARLKEYKTFILSEFHVLSNNPSYLLQHAINYTEGKSVSADAITCALNPPEVFPWDPLMKNRLLLNLDNKERDSKACVMTISEIDYTTKIKLWGSKYLFSSSVGRKIFLWDINSGQLMKVISLIDSIDDFELIDNQQSTQDPLMEQTLGKDAVDVLCACQDGNIYMWRLSISGTVTVSLSWQWNLHQKAETGTYLKYINGPNPLLVTSVSYFDPKIAMYTGEIKVWDFSNYLTNPIDVFSMRQFKRVEDFAGSGNGGLIYSVSALMNGKLVAFGSDDQNNVGQVVICSLPDLKPKWSIKHGSCYSMQKIDTYDQDSHTSYLLVSLRAKVVFVVVKSDASGTVSGGVLHISNSAAGPWLFAGSLNHLVAAEKGKLKLCTIHDIAAPSVMSKQSLYIEEWNTPMETEARIDEEAVLVGHESEIEVIASRSHIVATVALDGVIKLWDLRKVKPLRLSSAHKSPVYSCALMTNYNLIVTRSLVPDVSTKIWNAETGDLLRSTNNTRMDSVVYSCDGSMALTYRIASNLGSLYLFESEVYEADVKTYGFSKHANGTEIKLRHGVITGATFAPNGKYICLKHSADNLILLSLQKRIWMRIPTFYQGCKNDVYTGALFLNDGETLLTWGSSLRDETTAVTTIFKWNVETTIQQSQMVFYKDCCLKVFCKMIGHACSKGYKEAEVKSSSTARTIISSRDDPVVFSSACVLRKPNLIATATTNGLIQIRKESSLDVIREIFAHMSCVTSLRSANDGEWIVSLSRLGWIRVWRTKDLSMVAEFYNEVQISSLEIFDGTSPDLLIIFGDSAGQFKVLRIKNQEDLP